MPNYSFCLECIKGGICSTDSENDSVSGYFRPQVSLVSLSRHSALEAKKKKNACKESAWKYSSQPHKNPHSLSAATFWLCKMTYSIVCLNLQPASQHVVNTQESVYLPRECLSTWGRVT